MLLASCAAVCLAGMFEFGLEGAFTGTVRAAGADDLGYPCIVGAGSNASILHYEANSCVLLPRGAAGCFSAALVLVAFVSHHLRDACMNISLPAPRERLLVS